MHDYRVAFVASNNSNSNYWSIGLLCGGFLMSTMLFRNSFETSFEVDCSQFWLHVQRKGPLRLHALYRYANNP
jgi:hypothetical protein